MGSADTSGGDGGGARALPWRLRLRHLVEYAALRGAIGATRPLPPRAAALLGTGLGELVYRVLRIRRAVVEENLASTLGQLAGRRTCERLARDVYRHLGRTLVEHGRLRGLDHQRLRAAVEVRGLEHLDAALARGHGAIALTAHFGNWDLLGAFACALGYSVHVLVKPQRNPLVDRYSSTLHGALSLGELRTSGAGVRRVFQVLRAGGVLGILADQDAGPGGLFVDFLGRIAAAHTGPAVFALRTGAPIVPCAIARLAPGRHLAVFEPPLVPDPEAGEEAEVERLVRAGVAALERWILRWPEQWYWVHRRWKTPPPSGWQSRPEPSGVQQRAARPGEVEREELENPEARGSEGEAEREREEERGRERERRAAGQTRGGPKE